jgi:YD repeat-containing protein
LKITCYAYGDTSHPGDVTTMTDPDGKTWNYTWDAGGNRASAADPLGDKTLSCFDGIGRMTSQVSPKGTTAGVTCASAAPAAYTTYFTYNAFGDLLNSTDPLQHLTQRLYDGNRNLTKITDADNNVTTNHYDLDNEKDQVTEGSGTTQRTSKTDYNADGTVLDQVDGLSNTTTYGYNSLAQVTSVKDPLNRSTTYTHDGVGNLLTTVDAQTQTTTMAYDAADELTGITYSDGSTPNVTGIQYDLDGQRTQMSDETGTPTWAWDSLHRLTSSKDGAGNMATT